MYYIVRVENGHPIEERPKNVQVTDLINKKGFQRGGERSL